MQKETGLLFTIEESFEDPDSPYFGLLALDLTQIRPNYEAMIRAGHLKLAELLQSRFILLSNRSRRSYLRVEIILQLSSAEFALLMINGFVL